MWPGSTIRNMADEAAAKAALYAKNPYVIFDDAEIDRYGDQPCPFPNIGGYEPPGWELLRDENENTCFLFVDATGRDNSGPALGLEQLKRELRVVEKEADEKGDTYGYAIIETGQLQICIGIFRKTGEPEVTEPDEEGICKAEYEKQLELIGEVLSYHVDSHHTAAPTEEGAEEWTVKVYKWFFEHDQKGIELDTHGNYMPAFTLRRALPALIALDLLEDDSQLILRDIDLDGHRLRMWDTQSRPGNGLQTAIHYQLKDPSGDVIFEGGDFSANCIDEDDTVRSLMSFLTLTEGDVEDEYFKDYTDAQKDWRDANAEDLSIWGIEPDDDEFEYDNNFPMFEVEGEMTRFKPWGWKEKEDGGKG